MRAPGVRPAAETQASAGCAVHFWIVLGVQEGLAVCAISPAGIVVCTVLGHCLGLALALGSQQGCIWSEFAGTGETCCRDCGTRV